MITNHRVFIKVLGLEQPGITIRFDLFRKMTLIANFIAKKYRSQQRKSGTFQAAKNMRKQGYPIEIARAVLLS